MKDQHTYQHGEAEVIENRPGISSVLREKGVYLLSCDSIESEVYIEPPVELPGGLRTNMTTVIGCFTYSWSEISNSVRKVGRYCSIAGSVVFGEIEHSTSRLSTSSFTYHSDWMWGRFCHRYGRYHVATPFDQDLQSPPINIGNDVWIGQGAYIRGGVCLGDGCIVGACAVVTRDVPPYAIVAGNPSRVIRYRFDEKTIEALLALQWWRYAFPDLSGVDLTDVPNAVQAIGIQVAECSLKPYRPRLLCLKPAQTISRA